MWGSRQTSRDGQANKKTIYYSLRSILRRRCLLGMYITLEIDLLSVFAPEGYQSTLMVMIKHKIEPCGHREMTSSASAQGSSPEFPLRADAKSSSPTDTTQTWFRPIPGSRVRIPSRGSSFDVLWTRGRCSSSCRTRSGWPTVVRDNILLALNYSYYKP